MKLSYSNKSESVRFSVCLCAINITLWRALDNRRKIKVYSQLLTTATSSWSHMVHTPVKWSREHNWHVILTLYSILQRYNVYTAFLSSIKFFNYWYDHVDGLLITSKIFHKITLHYHLQPIYTPHDQISSDLQNGRPWFIEGLKITEKWKFLLCPGCTRLDIHVARKTTYKWSYDHVVWLNIN